MELRHKHIALIVVVSLILVFSVLALLYRVLYRNGTVDVPQASTAVVSNVSSTTPQILHVKEHAQYYDIDITYPSSTPLMSISASADAAAVAIMKKFAEDSANQFKTDGNFDHLSADDVQMMRLDQRSEALSSEYKMYTGARTVSYVFQIYEDRLGAHPNTYYKTFTFDTKTGQQVALKDLFNPTIPYLDRLSTQTRSDLPAVINTQSNGGGSDSDEIKLGTEPKVENFANFYLKGSDLVIVFAPYQVGPYALGTVKDSIPLSKLSDVLNSNYR